MRKLKVKPPSKTGPEIWMISLPSGVVDMISATRGAVLAYANIVRR